MNLDRVIAVRTTKTVYRDGGSAIKVFDDDYTKADVLNEALNQARIEETGLNIPRIKQVTTLNKKWAIVSDYIKGKTLARLAQENPEQIEQYLQLFVKLQLEIHSKLVPSLNRLKDKLNQKICLTELDATTRYDLHERLEDMPRGNHVCHGDFNPSNVVIAIDGSAYIIDWSHATQGNTYADVARTYLYFAMKDDLPMAEKYLSLYCEKSNAAGLDIKKWLPFVAAAQLSKVKAKDKDFLVNQAIESNQI